MSNDLTYKYRKEESNKNGSIYFKSGNGKRQKPFMSPYEYGCIKSKRKRGGK